MDSIHVRRFYSSSCRLVASFLLGIFTVIAAHGWGQQTSPDPKNSTVSQTKQTSVEEAKVQPVTAPAAEPPTHRLNSKPTEVSKSNGTTAPSAAPVIVDPRQHMSTISDTGTFITCVKTDDDGAIWIAAEEFGLSRLLGNALTVFTVDNGLIDNSPFTMEPDRHGGLWVGNRTAGLSHFDGRTWTHYGLLDGLGGVRVYDIAVPRSGKNSVWCATENGVSTFDGHTWRSFSLMDGLPEGEISAIALSPSGRVWAAGANGGLACWMGDTWKQRGADSCLQGVLINEVYFTADETCWVASQDGIYVRRNSENAKLPPQCESAGEWSRLMPHTFLERSFAENVITCIVEGHDGSLYFGTRRYGLFSYNPTSRKWGTQNSKTHQLPDNYVQSIAAAPNGGLVVGLYGYGVRIEGEMPKEFKVTRPPIESPASPMSSVPELLPSLNVFSPIQAAQNQKRVITYLGEDWETQGNWIGNYGTAAYILPAMGAPHDFRWSSIPGTVPYRAYMGPKHKKGDSLRYWVHARRTKDTRALQNPIETSRRQSSWDDAGELYPPDYGGPDLFIDIDLPPGHHLLSLYFVNFDCLECPSGWRTSDGLPLPNRFRDYVVQVFPNGKKVAEENNDSSSGHLSRTLPLHLSVAQTRVRSFNTGVYKRFCVSGPGSYTVHIARKTSHNAILSGIFIDPLPPVPALETLSEIQNETVNDTDIAEHVNNLLCSLRELRANEPQIFPIAMRIASIDLLHYLMPRTDAQLNTKTVPSLGLMECQSVLAQMLSTAGMSDSAAYAYASLGELWDRSVTTSKPDIRAQAIERCNRSLTALISSQWKSNFRTFSRSGWSPLETVQIAAGIYLDCLANTNPAALRRCAVASSGDRRLFSLAGIAWRKLSETVPNDSLSPEELDVKARYLLKTGDYKDAVTQFRQLADAVPDIAEKSSALEMLVYTAEGFTEQCDAAEKAKKELAELTDKRQAPSRQDQAQNE